MRCLPGDAEREGYLRPGEALHPCPPDERGLILFELNAPRGAFTQPVTRVWILGLFQCGLHELPSDSESMNLGVNMC